MAIEHLPPWDTGLSPTGVWFAIMVLGTILAIVIATIGNNRRKRKTIAPLEAESVRLRHIHSLIMLGHGQAIRAPELEQTL
jgi:hypothetical protein